MRVSVDLDDETTDSAGGSGRAPERSLRASHSLPPSLPPSLHSKDPSPMKKILRSLLPSAFVVGTFALVVPSNAAAAGMLDAMLSLVGPGAEPTCCATPAGHCQKACGCASQKAGGCFAQKSSGGCGSKGCATQKRGGCAQKSRCGGRGKGRACQKLGGSRQKAGGCGAQKAGCGGCSAQKAGRGGCSAQKSGCGGCGKSGGCSMQKSGRCGGMGCAAQKRGGCAQKSSCGKGCGGKGGSMWSGWSSIFQKSRGKSCGKGGGKGCGVQGHDGGYDSKGYIVPSPAALPIEIEADVPPAPPVSA